MKELVLHIGTHKTGTTSLQRFMIENAEKLAEQGLGVPVTPSKYPRRNRDRTGCFLCMEARKQLVERLWSDSYQELVDNDERCVAQSIAQHDRIYLSDERIWYEAASNPRYWDVIKATAHRLGITDFKIVVYLRRQDDFILSLWSQFVKGTERATLSEYLERKTTRCVLDYRGVIGELERVFGADNLIVRVFARNKLVGGDICRDFCDAIQIDWDDSFVVPQTLNPSLTSNLVEIKRIANNTSAYRETTNFLSKIALDTSAASTGPNPSLLSAAQRDEITARYAAGNAEIAKRYLGYEDGVLFEHKPASEDEWSALTPEMIHDMCYFFSSALAVEHERVRRLEQEVKASQKKIERLEHVYRNSIGMKLERFLRGRAKLERKP